MHVNKSFNRNPGNHRLYHALMEALIEDENAMDKGVANTIKDHKRKHDDDDDEDPLEPVEEPIAEVVMDDAGEDVVRDDDQPQDTSEPKTTKTPNPEWILNSQRSQMATSIDFSKYVLNRLKIDSLDNLTQDLLLGPTYNLLKGTCTSNIELEYNFQECFNTLTDKLDWNNSKEDHYPFDLSKPLPLQGRPGHLIVAADYFFNNYLEFLKTFDLEKTYTTSITKTKAARYEIVGIEYMTPTLWSSIKHAYDKDAEKGSSIRAKGVTFGTDLR
ncbi:hypothetical protein Tco_0949166 [Tanacetum coccineum]